MKFQCFDGGFCALIPKGPQSQKRALGVFGQVPITSMSIFYF